jgi:hypothetical protein
MRLRSDFKVLLQPCDNCMIGERQLSLCLALLTPEASHTQSLCRMPKRALGYLDHTYRPHTDIETGEQMLE